MPTAQEHFEAGLAHLEEKHYDEAMVRFAQAIELDPNYAEAYSGRARAYAERYQCDKVAEDLSRAVAILFSQGGLANLRKRFREEHKREIKKFVDSIKIDVEELKERSEEEGTKAWWYERCLGALLVLFFTLISAYFAAYFVGYFPDFVGSGNDPFTNAISLFGMLAALSFPWIWGLRLLSARRYECNVLREGYARKALLEGRIAFYAHDNEELRLRLIEKYVKHWMEKSPVEVLLALRKGQEMPTITPVQAVSKALQGKDGTS